MNAHHIATRFTIMASQALRPHRDPRHGVPEAPDGGGEAMGLGAQSVTSPLGVTPSLWTRVGTNAAEQFTYRVVDRLADHAITAVDRALTPEPTGSQRAAAMWRTTSCARVVLGRVLDASGHPAAKSAAAVLRTVTPVIDGLAAHQAP